LNTAQSPSDVSTTAPVVERLASALRAEGMSRKVEGLSAWTDAALLNEAGIPAICFGPGDIALAHSSEEWVAIDEIETATRVLTRFVADWCS
jgi:acetylornithine deacetylase